MTATVWLLPDATVKLCGPTVNTSLLVVASAISRSPIPRLCTTRVSSDATAKGSEPKSSRSVLRLASGPAARPRPES